MAQDFCCCCWACQAARRAFMACIQQRSSSTYNSRSTG
jgi:hypothetical protein